MHKIVISKIHKKYLNFVHFVIYFIPFEPRLGVSNFLLLEFVISGISYVMPVIPVLELAYLPVLTGTHRHKNVETKIEMCISLRKQN